MNVWTLRYWSKSYWSEDSALLFLLVYGLKIHRFLNQNEEDVSFYILFFYTLFFFKMKFEDFFLLKYCVLVDYSTLQRDWIYNSSLFFPETDWSSSRKTIIHCVLCYFTCTLLTHIVYEIFIEHEENLLLVYCLSGIAYRHYIFIPENQNSEIWKGVMSELNGSWTHSNTQQPVWWSMWTIEWNSGKNYLPTNGEETTELEEELFQYIQQWPRWKSLLMDFAIQWNM